jgi:DNA repair exonuclease SbcCD ATPase subunit
MHIQHLKISNILGITELEFDAGKFNEVAGPNGAGKTSILEAVKAALGSGHDATLLRKGAEQGEVVLVLDDGTAIRRRVKAGASDTQVKVGGKTVSKPGATIASIMDALSVNPVDFLRATKKDRARVLLEAMPLQVDRNRLHKISGLDVINADDKHALAVIDAVRAEVYTARTGTNRAVAEKQGTIKQLQAAMPEAPGGAEGDEDAMRAKLDDAAATRDKELQRISTKLGGLEDAHAKKKDALRIEANLKIDAIRAQLQADLDAAEDAMNEVRNKAQGQRTLTHDTYSKAAQPLQAAISKIAANRDAAAKRRVTLETIDTLNAEVQALEVQAEKQTKALDDIDAYKTELLAALPIPGVEVVNGEIMRDGVVFDRLNTAQQVQIAVEVAKLRAGALNVICVDGIELLNSASYEEFRTQALASGLQMFVSRVTDDDAMSINISE